MSHDEKPIWTPLCLFCLTVTLDEDGGSVVFEYVGDDPPFDGDHKRMTLKCSEEIARKFEPADKYRVLFERDLP